MTLSSQNIIRPAQIRPARIFVYSTFLGGTNTDVGYRIACDNNGGAYVTGYSTSPDFPNTATNVPGLYLICRHQHRIL